jgi:hypothetical protein
VLRFFSLKFRHVLEGKAALVVSRPDATNVKVVRAEAVAQRHKVKAVASRGNSIGKRLQVAAARAERRLGSLKAESILSLVLSA